MYYYAKHYIDEEDIESLISVLKSGMLTQGPLCEQFEELLADYFEVCASKYDKPKVVSNWIMGGVLGGLKHSGKEIKSCPVTPQSLVEMLKMIDVGTINGKIAKTVFEEMFKTGKSAKTIVNEKGLKQIKDNSVIIGIIDEVLKTNPNQVEEFKKGKEKLMSFFIGQVMKASKGQANPTLVNELLKEKLEKT